MGYSSRIGICMSQDAAIQLEAKIKLLCQPLHEDLTSLFEGADVIKQDDCARAWYWDGFRWYSSDRDIAFLEPTLVEILGASTLYAMAETVNEAVRRGISRDAAVSFLTGHINILSAVFLGKMGNVQVSDACKVAVQLGNRLVLRDDWKRIWEDDVLDKAIATMLHPDDPKI